MSESLGGEIRWQGQATSQILHAAISGATSGNNEVVAAVAGKSILVISYRFICITAVTVRFESDADGTALTGVESYAANGGSVNPRNLDGWFKTVAGEKLNMELGGAVQVSGCLSYILVD